MDDRPTPGEHVSSPANGADDTTAGPGVPPSDQPGDSAARRPVVTALVLRRDFLKYTVLSSTGFLATAYLLGEGGALSALAQTASAGGQAGTAAAGETVRVRLRINGSRYGLRLEPRVTLLDTLRERLHLTGTKKGCDHGQCGACTVLVNGTRINACLALAVMHDGEEITTIEGLAAGDQLHPVQAAFIRHDGFQCGYCTPGQICSAVAMLAEVRAGTASHVTPDVRVPGRVRLTDDEIRERMSGNLCRCGAYPGIVAAIREAGGSSQSPRGRKA